MMETLTLSNGKEVKLGELVKSNKFTVLHFSRYIGCPVCQLDLLDYKEMYELYKGHQVELVVLLQSSLENVQAYPNDFPFLIACDEDQVLYKKFQVKAANNMLKLLSIKVVKKLITSRQRGLKHGAYEGEEKQLPAIYVYNTNGRVVYSKQAENLGDVPNASELLNIIKKLDYIKDELHMI